MNETKLFEVEISPHLQITKAGLSIAINKIPYRERRSIGKKLIYSWVSVRYVSGKRIAEIKVEAADA